MPTRIYDSSQLTKRKAEKAIAGSFLSRISPPNNSGITPKTGSAPYLGITSSSIMNAVKTGHMTQYVDFGTCYGISPGCPCPEVNMSIATPPYIPSIPGVVYGMSYTMGSIIVSWYAPKTGDGPFTYRVTPYLHGVAQLSVTTTETSYRFTNLQELQPYTFMVCAINAVGTGPAIHEPTYFIAPPSGLSAIMNGVRDTGGASNVEPSLKYILNTGLNILLKYITQKNLGPTKGSRLMYIWAMSIVGAWNYIQPETRITATRDSWEWRTKSSTKLSSQDSIIWLCCVIEYVTPIITLEPLKSVFNCSAAEVARVKLGGNNWATWKSMWQTWYNSRKDDGYVNASNTMPITHENWSKTIVVDGTTITDIANFTKPHQWTRLTVQGKKQPYLTHSWDSVRSTCLTEDNELAIEGSVSPKIDTDMNTERSDEIDEVMTITQALSDTQKIIAEFWAGGPGTVSPPLMFIWFWKEYVRTLNTISCPDIMFSLLDLAIHLFEGGRITWRLKAKHMEARPIQEIRRRFTGQFVESWNGLISGSQWVPYQEANFVTPPFADFPSGHSHFSKAFALTMNKWFGETIAATNTFYDNQTLICPLFTTNHVAPYGTFIAIPGSSLIKPGIVPNSPVTLSFKKWDDMADQAGISRLYGGIHCLSAHTASQSTAVAVNDLINSSWNILTS